MFAGSYITAISSLGGASGNFWLRIWKGDPDFIFMFNWHFFSIFNSLDVIRLFYLAGISQLGAKDCRYILGQNDPRNVKWEKNTCWEGTFLRQTASFEPLCVNLSLSVWPVQVRKKKWREGRKEEKSQEVYISRMHGAIPNGRILTKLSICVRLSDVIKRAKFRRYNLRGLGAVRCWNFHFAIGNQGHP